MKKPGDESGFFVVVRIQQLYINKKGKLYAFLFLTIPYVDYQHLVLWNDDAGSPAPL